VTLWGEACVADWGMHTEMAARLVQLFTSAHNEEEEKEVQEDSA